MGNDSLCYWSGRSECIPLRCNIGCHFMQAEGFCLLASIPSEWPDAFLARARSLSMDESKVINMELSYQLGLLGGFSQDRIYMVLSSIGAVSAKA